MILLGMGGVKGQTVIGRDSFETSASSPSIGFTQSGGAFVTGSSASGDRPASSPFFVDGNRAFSATNTSGTLTTSDINVSSFSNIQLTFRVAAWSIGSTTNGIDPVDTLSVEISPDGGTTYYHQLSIKGPTANNAHWSYTSGTGIATKTYAANNSFTSYQPAGSGARTTDGYSTVNITSLPNVSNLRIRIRLRTNATSERFTIDSVVLVGTPSASAPTLTTPTATSITDVSATLGATVTADGGSALSARGTSYKTSSPVVAADNQLAEGGTSVAAFSHSRTGLSPQTQYFYAGYATNTTGTSLSTEGNFRTLSSPPTLQSSGVSAAAASSSQINLTINAATFPGSGATQAGYVVIYGTGTPTFTATNGQAPAAGVGSIFVTAATNLPSTPSTAVNVTGLASGTLYNFLVVPYTWDGTNAATYNYLTTSAPTASATTNSGAPALTTPTVSSITENSAILGATVTSNGGSALTARGTSYKTSSPVIATDNQLAEGGTSVAAFTHSRTSLSPQTQYFYVGYATNSSSTAISSEGNFRTYSNPPTAQAGLSATAASTTQINLTITTATFPGSGATQAGYVVIYSTGTPTLSSANGAAPAAGVGSIFATSATVLPSTPSTTVNVTGLTQSTLYNFLVVPYTWDGTNPETYNYLTTAAPTANVTTQGPVNIAIQDFETSPATPTWAYSGGGATNGTTSKFNGAASYRISGSQTLTMDNVDISNYTSVSLSVAYAGSGPDSGEDLYMDISYDNGSTWVGTGSVKLVDGFSNTNLDINTTNLSGPTTQASNPWPTSIAGSETQIRVRFRIDAASGATEYYFIDDVKITGTLNTSPTILVSPISLTGFAQTSATPSAEQTYTVSGNNLTANVSIVPPTGYEISTTTGGSFSATNPITLTQSGGDLVGEPVTIYVRQSFSTLGAVSGNISHTSAGSNNPNVAVSGTRTGTYYSKSSGNLDDLANWGLNTDGSGTAPLNFTSDGIIYEIRNRATATIGANWVVSGTASKVVVGDGTNATDFTIPSGFTLTGTIDVSNAAELTIENSTAPTFGTFATNSTLEYNNVAVNLSTATTYRNLKLTGSGTKTFPGNTTTITGNLTFDGITINGASGSPFSTILLAGNLTYVGTVTPPADGNSITLSTNGTAAGTQTITGAGNTVRWFRIQTTTANTILLSTTGGSSNIYLGNGAGGGITLLDGSILNMNGNDFQLFNTTSIGSAAFIMTTGTISTTSATDFTIERTVSGALGTLRFTTGANTIGNLTLNHTGTTTNTLTIGNALNVTGVIAVTDGTLASGGNITLKSTAAGTASIAAMGAGGSITGNVTVERYIPSSTRRYRFLSSPVTTTVADWRGEIFITGGGVSSEYTSVGTNNVKSNGLDWTLSGVPSMFGYTENISSGGLNTRWEAITSGNTSLTAGKGYRVFIRGDRSNAGVLDNTVTSQSAVTITSTGALNTGNQTLPVTYNGSTANDGWNLVGNPYASTIDWNASSGWTKTNVNGTIYIYNPSTNTYGTWDGATGTNNVTQNISSGQAFFVRTNDVIPVLSCTEAVKVTTAGAAIFKTDPENTLRVSLAKNATNSDETIIRFMDGKLDEFNDNDDVRKFINSEVNVSSNFGLDKYASVNYLNPASLTNSLVKLSAWVDENGTYKLNFAGVNSFATTPYVLLKDKFLNKLVDLKNNAEYQFTITDDAKTKDDNRFEVIFSNNSTSIENISNTSSTLSVYPNPATDVLNISVSNGTKVNNVNIYNVSGKLVTTAKVTANQINISELNNGVYFIEVLTENGKLTTKFVK